MKIHVCSARAIFFLPGAGFRPLARLRMPVLVLAMMAPAALTTTLFAQQSAEATGVATLSSNAELVLVPVQVRDSAGKPVRGLLQGDFVVRSDGKAQQIKIFEESGADRGEASSSEKQDAGSSGEKEFSSVPEGGLPQELLIVAIDQVNTPIAEQAHVRQELQKYFEKGTSGQALALVAITPAGLRQIQTFTSDPKVLLAAVIKEQGKLGKTEAVTDGRVAAHPLTCRYCDTEGAAYQSAMQGNASATTIESFAQLQQAYAGIQGRKSVVWLTTETTDAEPISNILNRSNISLYPVNVRGAQADSQFLGEQHVEYRSLDDPANVAHGGVTPVTSEIVGGLKKTEDNTGLRVLATRTGGRYCSSMAALQGCLDQAAKDSSSYYVLGFYVPQQERVVGWHKLDVHLTSGQEKIHTRSGYYLGAKSAQGEKDVRTELLVAANAEIGYTGVAFTVQRLDSTPATSGSSSANSLNFRIHVPSSSVALLPGQQKLSYEIAMVPLAGTGKPVSDVMTTRLDLNSEQTETALAKGWRYDETLAQTNELTAVKFLVRDNAANKIGSVTVPLGK